MKKETPREHFLWADKHAPKSFAEFLGNGPLVQEVRVWAQNWQRGQKMKPLLLEGGPGTGKTLLAQLLAKEMKWQLVESNASFNRGKEGIESFVGNASGVASFSGGLRLIFVDEVDGLSGNEDRGGAAALAKILKSPESPTILAANGYTDSLRTIRGLCKVLAFRKIPYTSVAKRLREVCALEGINFEPEAVEEVAKNCGGDLRAALTDLQNLSFESKSLGKEELKALYERDEDASSFEAMARIFKAKTYRDARSATKAVENSMDANDLILWVGENISKEYEYPFEVAQAFDRLSRADVFSGRVMRRQSYELQKYAYDLLSAGVALSKTEEYRKFVMYSPPKKWQNWGERVKDKAIAEKVSAACHVSVHRAIVDYLPFFRVIAKNSEKKFTHLSASLDLSEEELAHLSSYPDKKAKQAWEEAQALRAKEIGKHLHFKGVLAGHDTAAPERKDAEKAPEVEAKKEKAKDEKQTKLFSFG